MNWFHNVLSVLIYSTLHVGKSQRSRILYSQIRTTLFPVESDTYAEKLPFGYFLFSKIQGPFLRHSLKILLNTLVFSL